MGILNLLPIRGKFEVGFVSGGRQVGFDLLLAAAPPQAPAHTSVSMMSKFLYNMWFEENQNDMETRTCAHEDRVPSISQVPNKQAVHPPEASEFLFYLQASKVPRAPARRRSFSSVRDLALPYARRRERRH